METQLSTCKGLFHHLLQMYIKPVATGEPQIVIRLLKALLGKGMFMGLAKCSPRLLSYSNTTSQLQNCLAQIMSLVFPTWRDSCLVYVSSSSEKEIVFLLFIT